MTHNQHTYPFIFFILAIFTILLISNCVPNTTTSRPKAKALLATSFANLNEFSKVVNLKYTNQENDSSRGTVLISYTNNAQVIENKLTDGVTQGDIVEANKGNLWNKLSLVFSSPYAIWTRKELSQIYMLARRRPTIFGQGDIAFYDLALASMRNISPTNGAFSNFRDSLEKGYINTFNHVTAQALITTLYDEEIANYIATVHERHHMPQLVSGKFSTAQLSDTLNFPVDNYVDIINNEIGQELGKYLKSKYNIQRDTKWTPTLTAAYLNEIQDYYAYSFDIKIAPLTEQDSLIIRFANKIEAVKKGDSYLNQ